MYEHAIEALEELRAAAVLDGYARGIHTAEQDMTATAQYIRERADDTGATNPAYVPYPPMVEALVLIACLDPERYAAFMGTLGESDASTYDGFLQLQTILQGLGDDHDYTLDVRVPANPVLTLGQEHEDGISGATPASVMAAIEPLVAGLFDDPAQGSPRI